jgi:hypothetical protein
MKRPNCRTCIHCRDVPGDAHKACAQKLATVKGNDIGIRGGWFAWPYNFDPVWLEECDCYEKVKR